MKSNDNPQPELNQSEERAERLRLFEQAASEIGQAIEETGMTEEEFMAEFEVSKKEFYDRTYGNQS